MDLATATNAPREITLAGKAYRVSALTLAEWGELQSYLKDHAINPVVIALGQLAKAKAAGVGVTEEDRKALLAQAREEAKAWPPHVGSKPWFDALGTTEGGSLKFVKAVISKHQPDATCDEIARLNEDMSAEESELLVFRALGYVPAPDPKGGAAEGETTPPTTGQPPSAP